MGPIGELCAPIGGQSVNPVAGAVATPSKCCETVASAALPVTNEPCLRALPPEPDPFVAVPIAQSVSVTRRGQCHRLTFINYGITSANSIYDAKSNGNAHCSCWSVLPTGLIKQQERHKQRMGTDRASHFIITFNVAAYLCAPVVHIRKFL